jgi:hypothetical protein
MKTKIFILASILVLITSSGFATVRTVSNLPLGGSQYASLLDAYNNAVNGDTLILEGTNFEYYLDYSTQWNKQLTVLGNGINTGKENFKKTYIAKNASQNGFLLGSLGSGSSFYGITFTYRIEITGTVNNLVFENCEFNGTNYASFITNNKQVTGLTFRNCIFSYDNGMCLLLGNTAVTNVAILNCVFDGRIVGQNNSLNVLLIDHSLFLTTAAPFENVNTGTISNSIFMNILPSGTTNCSYMKNMCRVAGTLPPADNVGSGNIENSDPLLVAYTLNSFYSAAHDYDIQAGSLCLLAGTDGTDIGVHGGTAKFSEQGEPLIAPVMRSVVITTPVVAPNGILNVDVTASKPAEE